MNSLKFTFGKLVHGMADVIFEDNTVKVIDAMESKINIVLEEVAGEMEARVKRNQDRYRDTGNTTGSWKHRVDDDTHTAYIGSDAENAIWEEFGTGEFAMDGKGRRGGYWVYVSGSDNKSSKSGKTYTLKEAKRVVAIMRSKGLDAYYTRGKKPRRHLWKAYTEYKDNMVKHIQNSLKGL